MRNGLFHHIPYKGAYMQWIEVSIVCERVATDEVTTLFDDYAGNGIIEEDIEEEPNLIKINALRWSNTWCRCD